MPELRTNWFDGSLKPVHIGVYERDYGAGADGDGIEDVVFSFWDGMLWSSYGNTVEQAVENFLDDHGTDYQSEPWRGLTEQSA